MGIFLQPAYNIESELPETYYLATLGAGSQRAMRSALGMLANLASRGMATSKSCPWWLWTPAHSTEVRAKLLQRYKPATVNRHLTALRGVLKATWHLGLMTEKVYRQSTAFSNEDLLILPVANQPLPKVALAKLFKSCAEDTARSSRDAAILALLYGCGLRRQELVALDLKDFDPKDNSIEVLYGRGAQARLVYPPEGTQTALKMWLKHRGKKAGPLFKRIRRGDHVQDSRITDQSVLLVVKNRGKQAGMAALTAHELRQSFISNLLDQGAPLTAVQHLAGHRNAQSTLRYDRTAERAKEDAARKLMVPYKKPPTSTGT